MKDATKNAEVCELFTEGSHHCNLSVICLLQNLYYKGKENRTMNLNSQYLVLFKNPRDQQQVAILARQMYPYAYNEFLDKYKAAVKKPYGYLLVDLKQETLDCQRLKPNALNGINKVLNQDISHLILRRQRSNIMEQAKVSCIECGLFFSNPIHLQKHLKRGCPEDMEYTVKYSDESLAKKPKFELNTYPDKLDKSIEDKNVWEELVHKSWDKHDDKFAAKVDEYMESGLNEKQARQKASEELYRHYLKNLMQIYKDYVTVMLYLSKDALHNEIWTTMIESNEESFEKALDNAVRKHRSDFVYILDSNEESESENSESEQSEPDDNTSEEDDSDGNDSNMNSSQNEN
jgi:hypothetical protein